MQPKVFVHHYRVCVTPDGEEILASMRQAREQNLTVRGKGGLTEVQFVHPVTSDVLASGAAICSDEDEFCKRDGRRIATLRAEIDYGRKTLPAEERQRREERRRELERAQEELLLQT